MSHTNDSLQSLILDSIGEGVFTVDDQWRVTSFNQAAERLTGFSREEAIGMKCHDVFRADICDGQCALRRTLSAGEAQRNVEITILNRDMEEVPVKVSTAVLKDERGRVVGGVEVMRDISDVQTLRRALEGTHVFQDIVGRSAPMQRLFRLLPDVARSDVPVLLQGPSGTGKEMVAQAIHRLSDRSEAPFLQVNCGALPDTLLESELFGHRKGAFTDARADHPGRFVTADGGTLLLDEIGDTSAAFQVKLLRVLQEGEVQPLGATEPVSVDVRIISATHRDLEAMVQEGRFREDLFYRLRVMPITLPPLAERREDIPLLARHLLERVALRRARDVSGFTPGAMDALYQYDFPGNVRELENIIERALVLTGDDRISLADLPAEVVRQSALNPHRPPLGEHREENTRKQQPDNGRPSSEDVVMALHENHWNRQRTARSLGISRSTLWRWMKRMNLE